MAEKTFTIDDMIASVLEKQPDTFKDAFNDLIGQRAADAVLAKKEEVAKTVFNASEEQPEEEPEDAEEDDAAESEEESTSDESKDENGDQT